MNEQEQALEDILEEVMNKGEAFGLKVGDSLSPLRSNLRSWMGIPSATRTIVAWRVSIKHGNVIVITKKDDGMWGAGSQFHMGRLFTIGNNWHFSSDAQGSAEDVMQRMMEVM